MELSNEIDEIKNHTELKSFIENVSYMLINNEISPEKAKSLCMLIKQHSIEIDKANNEKPYWETS